MICEFLMLENNYYDRSFWCFLLQVFVNKFRAVTVWGFFLPTSL